MSWDALTERLQQLVHAGKADHSLAVYDAMRGVPGIRPGKDRDYAAFLTLPFPGLKGRLIWEYRFKSQDNVWLATNWEPDLAAAGVVWERVVRSDGPNGATGRPSMVNDHESGFGAAPALKVVVRTPGEAEALARALSGRPDVATDTDTDTDTDAQTPPDAQSGGRGHQARDFPPSFGPQTRVTEDGDTITYIMQLVGKAAASAIDSHEHGQRAPAAFKIGRSRDPGQRTKQLNFAFPSLAALRWEVKHQFRHLNEASAREMEKGLLDRLNDRRSRDAGTDEIVICSEGDILSAWAWANQLVSAKTTQNCE